MKNEGVKFLRIDSDLTDNFKEEVKEEDKEGLEKDKEKLEKLFKKVLGRDNIKVTLEKLKDENISSMVTQSEDTRRMQDMMKMYSFGDNFDPNMFGGSEDLVLNANNNLVKYLLEKYDGEAENVDETTSLITKQLYDLALLSHGPLSPESMSAFVERTNKMMTLLAK